MKRIAMVVDVKSCHQCPYHSGGSSLGSPMYCTYFDPIKQIMNSNGQLVTDVIRGDEHWTWIAAFCELSDDEIHHYLFK